MKTDTIRWYSFEKDDLPEVLFGEKYRLNRGKGRATFPLSELKMGLAVVGYSKEYRAVEYAPPSLIILDDDTSAEVFSWLRVYATETSPLSQFARVASLSDWKRFTPYMEHDEVMYQREDRWASVIVGEMLAQGESNVELENVPLSRASACFTTAVARASSIYGYGLATRECVERLTKIESYQRFVPRSVSVINLYPIWTIMGLAIDKNSSAIDAATLVFEAAIQFQREGGLGKDISSGLLHDYQGLFSDSVEERVVEFNYLVDEMLQFAAIDDLHMYSAEVALAAAVFLVGRSTSHVFLLQRFAKKFPTIYVWFGLMAAVAGPRCWTPDWSRAAKGTERVLRAKFDWMEPAVCDLSWAEFSWFIKTFEGDECFASLPKLLSRVLSVEVIPGATCQFRLLAAKSEAREVESRSRYENAREKELQKVLSQFVNLSDHVKELLLNQLEPTQKSLDFGVDSSNSKGTGQGYKPSSRNYSSRYSYKKNR